MKLDIVHLTPFFDPATQYGGPISVLRDVCGRIAERGHRVNVVTTGLGLGPEPRRDTWIERDGYRVWYGSASWIHGLAPYKPPRLGPVLERLLPAADVLHLSLGLTLTHALGRRAARRFDVPYVYTPHGVLCPIKLRIRRWSKAAFLPLFERRTIRDAAAIQVLTVKERDDLRRLGARDEQLRLIPNGVDMGDPARWPDGTLFRQSFDVPPEAPLVLFLGRLQRIKGIDLLLQAFAEAGAADHGSVLAIAGVDEDFGDKARRLVRTLGLDDAVRFTGRIDGDLRLSAFRAAAVFALTSFSEGLPMAVLEACAMGAPVLITETCNIPEVEAYEAGRIAKVRSRSIAEALRAMLNDDTARRAMGRSAQRMVADRFAMDTVIDALETLYMDVAERRTAAAR